MTAMTAMTNGNDDNEGSLTSGELISTYTYLLAYWCTIFLISTKAHLL
jgi:hypothetical protein